mmetsp:Transcript_14893/g.24406  ORF Transcript_14893/g.24406 Transcript_14893/m.24406 type:complete len:81 (-) Transcript_14893:6-248(-)
MTHKRTGEYARVFGRTERLYEGELNENGKPHGRGKWTYSNGNTYEGEWENGLKSGMGTFKWNDGGLYEGEWKDDKILTVL